ncbi:hypothetical protein Bbelb_143910 [Branchiostoma belcheri]|nr:hypothetical protein Bbelb_143910 [Branchiostoma belcheri]
MTECSVTSALVTLLYSYGQAKRDMSDAERRYALHREPSSSEMSAQATRTLSSGLKRRFWERMIGRPGDLLAVKGGESNPEFRNVTHAAPTSRLRRAPRFGGRVSWLFEVCDGNPGDLKWTAHINNTTAKANTTLGFLRRNIRGASVEDSVRRWYSPRTDALRLPTFLHIDSTQKHVRRVVTVALVRPKLEYTATVWGPLKRHKRRPSTQSTIGLNTAALVYDNRGARIKNDL